MEVENKKSPQWVTMQNFKTKSERSFIRKRQEREKYGLVANLNGCRFSIVKKIIEEFGYKIEESEDTSTAYLIWSDVFVAFEKLLLLRPYQRVNHFPGMVEICRKDFFARNYNRQAKGNPNDYNFAPKTWILPHEHSAFLCFARRCTNTAYIMKPANGAMGHGIRLFKHADQVPANPINTQASSFVVQEYISNPLLIGGYKFDLRVYVLVTSCSPLHIFVYNEGLVRLATEPYVNPVEPDGDSMFRHLTNYALNKRHASYVNTDDDYEGNKRSFAFLENYLRTELQSDPTIVWRRIRNLIVKTMLLGAPHIYHAYRLFHRSTGRANRITVNPQKMPMRYRTPDNNQRPTVPVKRVLTPKPKAAANVSTSSLVKSNAFGCRSAAFEVLGFDILLDQNLRPWLLEVNRSPSFGVDSDLDRRVKSNLLKDTLNLVNIRPSDKKRSEDAQKAHSIRRLLFTSPGPSPRMRTPGGHPSHRQTPRPNLSPYSFASMPAQNSRSTKSFSTKKMAISTKNSPYQLRKTISPKDLASDWLKNPTKLMDRIRQLKERIEEIHQESELECFENANCGNWRRVYPTQDRNLELQYARLLTSTFTDFNKGREGDLNQVIQTSQCGGQQEDELLQQLDYLEKEAKKIMAPKKRFVRPTQMSASNTNVEVSFEEFNSALFLREELLDFDDDNADGNSNCEVSTTISLPWHSSTEHASAFNHRFDFHDLLLPIPSTSKRGGSSSFLGSSSIRF